MPWNTVRIKSWSDYTSRMEGMEINDWADGSWQLRGQPDEEWSLQPSLARTLGSAKHLNVEAALKIEEQARERFVAEHDLHAAPLYPGRSPSPIVWWAVMQHHSCPTRLLDWSVSPYVALYFAVEQLPSRDATVWLFPRDLLLKGTEAKYGPFELNLPRKAGDAPAVYPWAATRHSPRSASQQGVFTVCTNPLSDHADPIREALAGLIDSVFPTKFVIPARLKDECLSRLRLMNITPAALFPGLDGVGRSVRDFLRMRTH